MAGKAARRVFENSELIVVTTEENVAEVVEYLPEFAKRYGISNDLLLETLSLLPITIYAEREYVGSLPEARRLLADRDPDDVALGALAIELNIPIRSNDRDYENFPTGVFTTARLLAIISR